MTRHDEIWNAIFDSQLGVYDESKPSEEDMYDGSDIQEAFYKGAEWADAHPKSPWISVEDDLPCNHEDMIFETNPLDKDTDCVLVRFSYGGVSIECMHCRGYKQKWSWSENNITHWMPIPKLSK